MHVYLNILQCNFNQDKFSIMSQKALKWQKLAKVLKIFILKNIRPTGTKHKIDVYTIFVSISL